MNIVYLAIIKDYEFFEILGDRMTLYKYKLFSQYTIAADILTIPSLSCLCDCLCTHKGFRTEEAGKSAFTKKYCIFLFGS